MCPVRSGFDSEIILPVRGSRFDPGRVGLACGLWNGDVVSFDWVTRPRLLPESRFAESPLLEPEPVHHYLQWTNAIRGSARTSAGFDDSGPLTETVLLGTIAARVPELTLEWDAQALRFKNSDAASEYVRQPYRNGWEVAGL